MKRNPQTVEKVRRQLSEALAGVEVYLKDWSTVPQNFTTEAELQTFAAIAQGGDLDNPEPYTGNTALTMACGRSATVEIAKRLIEAGADVHAQGNDGRTALMWASGNSGELVRMLLEKGADPAVASPVDGATALGECLMGNLTESVTIEVCDLLVERGANVDAEITQPEQLSGGERR